MDLLELLDLQWSHGSAHIADILQRVPRDNKALARELCAADLEWRWRLLQGEGDKRGLPKPSAADYQSLLGDRWNDPICKRDLYEAEWCARSLWGDEPDVDEFARHLPAAKDWNDELSRQIAVLVPLTAVLKCQSQLQPVAYRVNHRFVVGRQRSQDPPAPGWAIATGRLVAVSAHFRTVSREHLQVRRTGAKQIELTNLSRAASVHGDNYQLQSGQSVRRLLPSAVEIGTVNIRFVLNDAN